MKRSQPTAIEHPSTAPESGAFNRRQFLTGTATMLPLATGAAGVGAAAAEAAPPPADVPSRSLSLQINGRTHRMTLDNRTTLLDALREALAFAGPKQESDHGHCGACTVHDDGQ